MGMRNSAIKVGAALLLIALAAGCSGKSSGEADKAAASSPKGKPPVAVDVQKVGNIDFETAVDVVGTLAPKFETLVRAEIKSRVTEVYVTQWVPVAVGQPLSKSDTRDIDAALAMARASVEAAKSQEEAAKAQTEIIRAQKESLKAQEGAARAGLSEAEIALVRAERELARLKSLMESGLATRQSLDEASSVRDGASARVEAAKGQISALGGQVLAADAQINAARAQISAASSQSAAAAQEANRLETTLEKAVVRAPMNGIVAERFVNVGDLPGDTPLFRIVDNRLMDLTVSVPMSAQAAIAKGQTLTFTTDALPNETFSGSVMFINPGVNQADRSIGVLVEVPNPNGLLKGGFFVKGRIVTGQTKGALAVPRSALLAQDVATRTAEVFVVASGTAKKRKVGFGATQGDLVEIREGLVAGETVITRGGFSAREGDQLLLTPAEGGK